MLGQHYAYVHLLHLQVVKETGIVKGGPSTWNAEVLTTWISQQVKFVFGSGRTNSFAVDPLDNESHVQDLSGPVVVPAGMTGKQVRFFVDSSLLPLLCIHISCEGIG